MTAGPASGHVPDLLDQALADLAAHPDSTAKTIARRLGANDRDVFAVLDRAAYQGLCQRWRYGTHGTWFWELPGCIHDDDAAR